MNGWIGLLFLLGICAWSVVRMIQGKWPLWVGSTTVIWALAMAWGTLVHGVWFLVEYGSIFSLAWGLGWLSRKVW